MFWEFLQFSEATGLFRLIRGRVATVTDDLIPPRTSFFHTARGGGVPCGCGVLWSLVLVRSAGGMPKKRKSKVVNWHQWGKIDLKKTGVLIVDIFSKFGFVWPTCRVWNPDPRGYFRRTVGKLRGGDLSRDSVHPWHRKPQRRD